MSDAEEADLLSLIEMTEGGDVWLTWWRRCALFSYHTIYNYAIGFIVPRYRAQCASNRCLIMHASVAAAFACVATSRFVPGSCGHCARRAEQSEADLVGDIANDEPTLAQKRLG